jgi:hypothetical protein
VKRTTLALAFIGGSIAGSCLDATGPCPPYIGLGLVVAVVDDRTGEPICDAVVTVRDGSSSWALSSGSGCQYTGAHGSGVYSVQAERAGFRPVQLSGVRVRSTGGECPVAERTAVTVRLAPVT